MAENSKNERVSQARQQGVLWDTSLWIRYFRPRGDEKSQSSGEALFWQSASSPVGWLRRSFWWAQGTKRPSSS